MSLLKYFSWKKTTSATKEIPHELTDPSGNLEKEIPSSLLLGVNLDNQVRAYLKAICERGGAVNTSLTIAIGTGIEG